MKAVKGETLELNLSGFDYLGHDDINGTRNGIRSVLESP